ncbi:MAG: hypothetical protein RSA99_06205, partial [Oscillospiraceae bacterium]
LWVIPLLIVGAVGLVTGGYFIAKSFTAKKNAPTNADVSSASSNSSEVKQEENNGLNESVEGNSSDSNSSENISSSEILSSNDILSSSTSSSTQQANSSAGTSSKRDDATYVIPPEDRRNDPKDYPYTATETESCNYDFSAINKSNEVRDINININFLNGTKRIKRYSVVLSGVAPNQKFGYSFLKPAHGKNGEQLYNKVTFDILGAISESPISAGKKIALTMKKDTYGYVISARNNNAKALDDIVLQNVYYKNNVVVASWSYIDFDLEPNQTKEYDFVDPLNDAMTKSIEYDRMEQRVFGRFK